MHSLATILIMLACFALPAVQPEDAHAKPVPKYSVESAPPPMNVFCKKLETLVIDDHVAISKGETPIFYHPEFERRSYRRGKKRKSKYQRFTDFRIEHYGNAVGARATKGSKAARQKNSSRQLSKRFTFLGLNVRLNQDVKKVLACVEWELKELKSCEDCEQWTPPTFPENTQEDANECNSTERYHEGPLRQQQCEKLPYKPKRLSGIRGKNSFRGWEFSNHLWGIAIDLDPRQNTCCKCVAKWRAHPKCRVSKDRKCPPDRMIMPVCWVEVFEKYGFRWLGWPEDGLEDTMHFEFLSDPKIVRAEWEKARSTARDSDHIKGETEEGATEVTPEKEPVQEEKPSLKEDAPEPAKDPDSITKPEAPEKIPADKESPAEEETPQSEPR